MDIQITTIVLATVVLINLALTLIIFSRGLHRLAHILFASISLCAGLWGLAIIGFYSKSDFFEGINWVIITHTLAALIALLFLYFAFNFPHRIVKNPLAYIAAAIPFLGIIIAIFSGTSIIGATDGLRYEINPGYFWYGLVVFLLFFAGYYFLYRQYLFAKNNDERNQVKLVLAGSVLSSLLAIIPDLILPYYDNFSLTWLGPIFTLILVGSIFFAIVRYGLFNVKVILAESTLSVVIVLLSGELLFVNTVPELLLKTIGVIIIVTASYFLIKSVYKEIEQREHIEKLAKDLSNANDRLRELDKQKSEFVSFASHQLRSPLTAIKGYASMILEGDFGVIGDGLKDAVDKIFESSKTLATVVDDYLNISRIELGTMKYNFVPLDLRELTETVIGELKPNFEKAGVSWKFECDASKKYIVKADPDKLKQVIANIVDNSMKYSPKGNAVISVTRDETRHIAQFKISDNGIGMSTVTLAKLFNKFTRADNANQTNIRGTGLGLYVARDVIGAHKGKIWAESDGEGKGSRFIFELALI